MKSWYLTTIFLFAQIQHIQAEKLDLILSEFNAVCGDVITISNFYDITFPELEIATNFRRGVSIKLPKTLCTDNSQPEENDSDDVEDVDDVDNNDATSAATEAAPVQDTEMDTGDILVMHKTQEGWKVVEQRLKFTRTSVMFDVKTLGR